MVTGCLLDALSKVSRSLDVDKFQTRAPLGQFSPHSRSITRVRLQKTQLDFPSLIEAKIHRLWVGGTLRRLMSCPRCEQPLLDAKVEQYICFKGWRHLVGIDWFHKVWMGEVIFVHNRGQGRGVLPAVKGLAYICYIRVPFAKRGEMLDGPSCPTIQGPKPQGIS